MKLMPEECTEAMADAVFQEMGSPSDWMGFDEAYKAMRAVVPDVTMSSREEAAFRDGIEAAAQFLLACDDHGDRAKADEIRKLKPPAAPSPEALPASGVEAAQKEPFVFDGDFSKVETGFYEDGTRWIAPKTASGAVMGQADKRRYLYMENAARDARNAMISLVDNENLPKRVTRVLERASEQIREAVNLPQDPPSALAKPASEPAGGGVRAWSDVLAERRRQVEAEGWTPEHDDAHDGGELARAAACYAAHASAFQRLPVKLEVYQSVDHYHMSVGWPWTAEWWKPKGPRHDLVKAAALTLAEIERLDRKEGSR